MTQAMVILRLLLALATFYVVGDGIIFLACRKRVPFGRTERRLLSFALGVGALAFLQLYVLVLHLPITGFTIVLLVILFWAVFLTRIARRAGQGWMRLGASFIETRQHSLSFSFLETSMLLFIAWLSCMILVTCVVLPKYTWDARAVWGLIAKILYTEHTIFTPDYLDPFRYHPAPSYPLLMPLTENLVNHALGFFDEYLVKSLYGLFYVCWLCLLYHAMRSLFRCARGAALAALCVAAAVPAYLVVYCGSVPSAFVDFPLSFLFTFVVVYLLKYFKTRARVDLFVSSVFLGFCLFTKQEGIPLFLLSVVTFTCEIFWSGRFRDKAVFRDLFIYAGVPLLLTVPWFLVRASIPAHVGWTSPFMRSLVNFGRQAYVIPKILALAFRHVFTNITSWSFLWYLVVACMFLFPGKATDPAEKRSILYLVVLPFAYFFFCVTPVYMSLSLSHVQYPVEVEFGGASFERVMMHMLPLLILYVGIVTDRLFRRAEPAEH